MNLLYFFSLLVFELTVLSARAEEQTWDATTVADGRAPTSSKGMWIADHKCPRGRGLGGAYTFKRAAIDTLGAARARCAESCDWVSWCKFADLAYDSIADGGPRATCYIRDANCGRWQDNTYPHLYHLYLKDGTPSPTPEPTPGPTPSPTTPSPTPSPTPGPTPSPTSSWDTIRYRLTVTDTRPEGEDWANIFYSSFVGEWGRDRTLLTWDTSKNEDVVVFESPVGQNKWCMYWNGQNWRVSYLSSCAESSDPSSDNFGSGVNTFCGGFGKNQYDDCTSWDGQLKFEWRPITLGNWKRARRCPTGEGSALPSGYIATVFRDKPFGSLLEAKERCAETCDSASDCEFADLAWSPYFRRATCYIVDGSCTLAGSTVHSAFHFYMKATPKPTLKPTATPSPTRVDTFPYRLTVTDARASDEEIWMSDHYPSYVGEWGRDRTLLTWDSSKNENVVVIESPFDGKEWCIYWDGYSWRSSSLDGCGESSNPEHENHGAGWHYFCPSEESQKFDGCTSWDGQLKLEWRRVDLPGDLRCPPGIWTCDPTVTPGPRPASPPLTPIGRRLSGNSSNESPSPASPPQGAVRCPPGIWGCRTENDSSNEGLVPPSPEGVVRCPPGIWGCRTEGDSSNAGPSPASPPLTAIGRRLSGDDSKEAPSPASPPLTPIG